MAERSITIRLKADVANAITGIAATAAAVKDFGTQTLASADRNAKSWDRVGKTMLVTGAAVAAAIGLAVHAAVEFDKAMSTVEANVDDKSIPSLARLRDAALEAGQTTAFSATQAAEAENELAKAGISAADIVGGALTASLQLASAGQLDLESAAAITSATMVQFGLTSADAAHIADDLAAGADKSLGSVQDLGEAMKYAGVFSAQLGISLDTTVGTLAQFASYGIIGSQAGTGLRQILLSLTAPTVEAQAAMTKYGISVFDASGKFVGLDKVAGQLHDRLGPLTDAQKSQALATIFTSRSIAEANILMKDGADGTLRWTAAVNDQGFAAQQARTKLDNLAGDLTKFKNTVNVALIETGDEATGALRGIVEESTNLVAVYNSLSPAGKGVVVTTAAIVSGVLLLGGALVIAVPKVVAFGTALKTLTGASTVLSSLQAMGSFLLGPWGIALAAATVGLGLFVKASLDSAGRVRDLTTAIEDDSYALGANTREAIANNLAKQGLLESAHKLGVNITDLTQAAEGNAEATARVNAELDTYLAGVGAAAEASGARGFAGRTTEASVAVEDFRNKLFGQQGELGKAKQAANDHAEAVGKDAIAQQEAAASGHDFSTSLTDVSGNLKEAKFDVTAFDAALTNLGHAFDVKDKSDQLTKGFRDLAKQAKGASHEVRGNSDAAIANRQALHQLYGTALDVIQAYADQKDAGGNLVHSSDEVKAKAKEVADRFSTLAGRAGFGAGKVKDLTDNLADVPAEVSSNVTIGVDTVGVSRAAAQLGHLQGLMNKLAASDFRPPHSATGQSDWPGGLSWVGEEGPELVRMPKGSQVYPTGTAPRDAVKMSPQFAAAQAGAGGPQFSFAVTAPPNTRNPYAWGERMVQGAQRVIATSGLGG